MGLSIDREKVIKGLELCKYDPDPGQEDKWNHSCLKCPYCWSGPDTEPFTTRDCWKLIADALALLKEQDKQIEWLEYDLAVTQNNLNYYINGND